MKKVLFIAIVLIAFVFIISLFGQDFTYVGAAKCKTCHKSEKRGKQFPIWEESKHSKSFAALSSPDASAKAQEAGVENPVESPKCLSCHAPLSDKAADFKEEGVTCEVCHGPGSAYKKLNIMKSREESVANGMVAYESPDAIKKHCLSCHENAHEKSFDFDAAWEKIKHPVPETE
ncbi:MAG: cytochrome C554 [Candidatus Aminicenantes bacterium]|nr:cytochrome C554 [Candidatus Aminicenantes bacterium]